MAEERILIVEPDPDIRSLMAVFLKRKNYTVSAASNTREGIDFLCNCNGEGPYSLLITETDFRERDGVSFVKEIMQRGLYTGRVIFFSGAPHPKSVEEISSTMPYAKLLCKPDIITLLRNVDAIYKS